MPKFNGVWVVFAYDATPYPIAVFDTEIEAMRISNGFGYTHVKFWRFNQMWDDLHKWNKTTPKVVSDGNSDH